ncbi:MAG: L-threonylcarbamoyladenylate synthase [Symplocastrum torsivum CPER-KK1]|jgi:L-threonylcarbamoyladenylate synthase|uniref:L-threonylcarbamoyladenylate synthase n=1 Tax=Symplocastrum torsivum CPER-KK1 TaxID=450513 RepID=A0A951PJT9_9CYAN|nr:L-threonylcarbamoyladenylate synthase [Symplocastrum torsivum CPER-KK1]
MTQVSMSTLIAGARSGQLVSFPTDTVPALAVRPDCSELVFAAKQRNQAKPLILMGDSAESLLPYISGTVQELEIWQRVAKQYWPGALTLVLPASAKVPAAMNPTDSTTIGIRVPNSEIAIAILSETGPLATTSANRSGEPPLQTIAEIEEQFPEVLTLQTTELEAAKLVTTGVPSTVAKWTQGRWEILRQGAVQVDS